MGVMQRSVRNKIPIILLSLGFIGLFYASTLLNESYVEVITNKAGWFGPLCISLFILITQVFAPLSGTPGIFVGIKLYGFISTLIILYFTSLLSAIINFWLARTWGRKTVAKFVGEKTLSEIDELSSSNERALLITARIFGYYFFDVISYAVGLTKIRFRKYFIYTALLTLIPTIAQYLIFSKLNFNSFVGMLTYFASIAATGVIFTRIFYKVFIRKRNVRPETTTSLQDSDEASRPKNLRERTKPVVSSE